MLGFEQRWSAFAVWGYRYTQINMALTCRVCKYSVKVSHSLSFCSECGTLSYLSEEFLVGLHRTNQDFVTANLFILFAWWEPIMGYPLPGGRRRGVLDPYRLDSPQWSASGILKRPHRCGTAHFVSFPIVASWKSTQRPSWHKNPWLWFGWRLHGMLINNLKSKTVSYFSYWQRFVIYSVYLCHDLNCVRSISRSCLYYLFLFDNVSRTPNGRDWFRWFWHQTWAPRNVLR